MTRKKSAKPPGSFPLKEARMFQIARAILRSVHHGRWYYAVLYIAIVSCEHPDDRGAMLPGDFELLAEPCTGCEIALHQIASLGGEEDFASVSLDAWAQMCAVTRTGTGDFAVGAVVGGGQVLIYSTGGSLKGSIGRPGEGPGEFGSDISVVGGKADTLYVLDQGNARLQTFTLDGRVVGSFRLPRRIASFAVLDRPRFLLHPRPVPFGQGDSTLFYFLSADGNLVGRAGDTREYTRTSPWPWLVAPASSGGFWQARSGGYVIRRHDTEGSVATTLRRNVDWFPTEQTIDMGSYSSSPPQPAITHIWEDSDRRLWVFAAVADANWVPRPASPLTPEWARDQHDMMVEVIDPSNRRVIASSAFDGWLAPVCGTELMFQIVETPAGNTRIQIVRPELRDPDSSSRN